MICKSCINSNCESNSYECKDCINNDKHPNYINKFKEKKGETNEREKR